MKASMMDKGMEMVKGQMPVFKNGTERWDTKISSAQVRKVNDVYLRLNYRDLL